jgi:hypothetical protein
MISRCSFEKKRCGRAQTRSAPHACFETQRKRVPIRLTALRRMACGRRSRAIPRMALRTTRCWTDVSEKLGSLARFRQQLARSDAPESCASPERGPPRAAHGAGDLNRAGIGHPSARRSTRTVTQSSSSLHVSVWLQSAHAVDALPAGDRDPHARLGISLPVTGHQAPLRQAEGQRPERPVPQRGLAIRPGDIFSSRPIARRAIALANEGLR